MKTALYAFSGDPITYGHIDIVKRASGVFDKVLVGIGVNPSKSYLFDLEERVDMARRSLANIPNAEVTSFKGLLVDYAYENKVDVIVKGVRNAADFDYENILHQMGESQKLGIDTHILFAKPELAHVSSSAVKALQKEHGLIHQIVPLYVKQRLEAKMSGQYILGVTGEIGAGKSYVGKRFSDLGKEKGIGVHNLELDYIGHQILEDLKEPRYEQIRASIIDRFGPGIRSSDGTINRKALGEEVFNHPDKLAILNHIMYTPMLVRIRKELYGKKGLILFNAALIAESSLSHLCNNNVLLIEVDKKSQQRRLQSRGLDSEQIHRRLRSQYCLEQKKSILTDAIDKDNQGKIWTIDNSDNSSSQDLDRTFYDIIQELSVK